MCQLFGNLGENAYDSKGGGISASESIKKSSKHYCANDSYTFILFCIRDLEQKGHM